MAKNGYWVVSYQSVSDPAAISEYAKLARTALEALGGRVIVADKPAKTHEAGVQQLVVVVEFENLEKAIAAYESDLYKPALKAFDKPHKGIFVSSKGDDPVENRNSFGAAEPFLASNGLTGNHWNVLSVSALPTNHPLTYKLVDSIYLYAIAALAGPAR
jgi:uncharacterized protein (DUF1330 family)